MSTFRPWFAQRHGVRALVTVCMGVASLGRAEPAVTADARLRWVYVRFAWPLGVDYVLLHGSRATDGATVEERL